MADSIRWPLLLNRIRGGKENNTFGMVRHHPNGNAKPHQGWDLEAIVGVMAYAIADGEVVFVRNKAVSDYGIQVCLKFKFRGADRWAFYAHLEGTCVSPGRVKAGDLIGRCGKSGNAASLPASEDHLHFEIRTRQPPGPGLAGRVSPVSLYGRCPLTAAVVQLRE